MTPKRQFVLVLIIGWLLGAVVVAHQPPRDLHLVGDHWTAWNPPAEFSEGSEVYIIEVGDTLWDLAEHFHGDPYLWPQIWEQNPYIEDAHWIYPGDPLAMGLDVTSFDELASATEEGMAGEDDGFGIGDRVRPPTALGTESDLRCSGYIDEPDLQFGYEVIGSEYNSLTPTVYAGSGSSNEAVTTLKVALSPGDIVYVDGGHAGGLSPGSVFTVVQPEKWVRHPLSDRVVGRYYRRLGQIRILSVQEESAIAEITFACQPISIGARMQPFEPEPVPLARRTPTRPVNMPVASRELEDAGAIVFSDEGLISLGEGSVVYIDRGVVDDVTPGDIYTIYRRSPQGHPPVVLGELGVLSVQENSSLAKILASRYVVHLGDRIVIK